MKELWEQILKIVPSEALPALLLIACTFFGVYYTKGLRSYSDVANDKFFLTATVAIVAGFLIYWVHRSELPLVEKGNLVALVVPRFDNDENRQLETLFSQQVQAAIHSIQSHAAVVQFDGYVRDRSDAVLMAKALKAANVVFQPKVLRVGDKTLICFSLFTAENETTKPYPPLPAQIEKVTLDDLSISLVGSYVSSDALEADSLSARVMVLEQRVAALAAVIRSSPGASASQGKSYTRRRAIIVGVNRVATPQFPKLASAVSDARGVAAVLKSSGIDVDVLLDDDATSAALTSAIARASAEAKSGDLTIFYYAGASFSTKDVGPPSSNAELVLATFDVSLDDLHANTTLPQVVQAMRNVRGDKLIIIDGCHGTSGVSVSSKPEVGAASSEIFQVMASTQDDESAADLPSGGAFTQSLLKHLMSQAEPGDAISTSALLPRISADIATVSQLKQHPKLVTLSGHGDIMLEFVHK
jgi:hypothetical protein